MSEMRDAARVEPGRLTDFIAFGVLTRLLNRDLIDEVLNETGAREQRSRLLPSRVVIYYVLALSLFFGDSYEEVMRRLVGGLRFLRNWRDDWKVPTTGAIAKARVRVGEAPLKALFERVAQPCAQPGTPGAWFRRWRIMAVDGVVIDVPDTVANDEEFGRSSNDRGHGAFPQVRVVGVGECGTHALVAASVGGYHARERELFRNIISQLDADMLVLADRGFYSYDLWQEVRATGADVVWRIKSDVGLPVEEILPDGSYRSTLLPRNIRKELGRGKKPTIPAGTAVPARVVEYVISNRDGAQEIIRLATSILDHELAPAYDLAALYHERWEFELALDEIETHQIGRPRVLRSKTPNMVRQEIWGLLLTHYAIRHFMREAADDIGTDPDRLSFIRTLRLIRRQVTDQAAFSPLTTEPCD